MRVFERPWLVNLILLGNYHRLGRAALEALGPRIEGRLLQVACVYGALTPTLCDHLAPGASLDVVDILPVQLDNLRRKLEGHPRGALIQADSGDLPMAGGSYDQVLLFFLLHEQPPETRRRTLEEAFRVLKPGGKLVIVDYSKPVSWHPVRFGLLPILGRLEPYARALWQDGIAGQLPDSIRPRITAQTPIFQGLYERVVITK